ncbi:MAG: [FeFe] hydrogenase H-cluster radical SAM maturase HydG, partial [Proteobacteria bacterium]|nr:[FeFe] hydrogenase H-cluster radical SAM maturase HydG [Pseudomonadota bacterium]
MKLDTEKIESLLADTSLVSKGDVEEIIAKALKLGGLNLEEAAVLLKAKGPELTRLIADGAALVKEKVFGSRVVFFAPLYLTNYCSNGCVYCGFRSTNKSASRKALTPQEAAGEALALEERGFKRALLVLGEDPERGVDYIIDVVNAIYKESKMR